MTEEDDDRAAADDAQYVGPTLEQVTQFKLIHPLLQDLHGQFTELSKKKPDATVSKMKVSIVNRLLTRCRVVLAQEEELEFLDLLEDASLPQISDALIVISQYVTAMKEFKSRYYYKDNPSDAYGRWYWHVSDGGGTAADEDDDGDQDEEDDEDEEEDEDDEDEDEAE